MQHLQNKKHQVFFTESKRFKRGILNTINRRHTICCLQSDLYHQIQTNLNFELFHKRSYSSSHSTYDQDSNLKEDVSKSSKDDQNNQFQKNQENRSQSESQSIHSSKKSNQKKNDDDINNIYQIRQNEVDFQQFKQDFQLDVLQLEALYYYLSRAGFQRSAPLQIPPYLSYYFYSLILYRSDIFKILAQYIDMKSRDQQRQQLMELQGRYFSEKLNNQCLSQIEFYNYLIKDQLNETMVFDLLAQIIYKLNFDYNLLLDDFLKYFLLSTLQVQKIKESLGDTNIYMKNNIALGNIRFVFKKKGGELINFKFPIGNFSNIQFYDYVQFLKDFAKQLPITKSIQSFNEFLIEPHSERTMILYLLVDFELKKTILRELNESLNDLKNTNQIQNLIRIYLEITTENRICSQCVSVFQHIPVEFICQTFQECCGLRVDQKFQFIIISQYLLDPQKLKKQKIIQRIWRREEKMKINNTQTINVQKQADQTDSVVMVEGGFQEYFQEDIKCNLSIQKVNVSQQQLNEQINQFDPEFFEIQTNSKQDKEKQEQQDDTEIQEYLICYEEQEPPGLVSVLLLNYRYCQGASEKFKRRIDQIQLDNTFFLSNESKSKTKSGSSENSKSSKQSNRLYDGLISYNNELLNHLQQSQSNNNKTFRYKKRLNKYDDIMLEIRSEFYALLIKKLTCDFKQLNTMKFRLDEFFYIYWQIGHLSGHRKDSHKALIKIFKQKLMLHSILESGYFNMKLFLKDYLFIQDLITPQILEEISGKNEGSKILIDFYQIKFYGQEEGGEFQKIVYINNAQNCSSLLQIINEQIPKIIKKFKKIQIIILSICKFNKKCKEAINNQVLNLQLPNLELKYISILQKPKNQGLEQKQESSQISECEWKLLDVDFLTQRYALLNEGLYSPFKELCVNADQELMSFYCQVHPQKKDNL
ncbi:unnamed protein product [Paramecium pentaurelia]|uniref:Uncharacterized protein n=1 Tax=Paramecium pentaurelia TaxID=43138 RepID=A0A8S1S0X3_9CILI|nr:unnamed protein product [Paramecium pentaurelia]